MMKMNQQSSAENMVITSDSVKQPSERVKLEGYDAKQELIDSATPNSHEIENVYSFLQDGTTYTVGKSKDFDVEFSPSDKEKEMAQYLKENFGGDINLMPKVNYSQKIQVPDFLWNGERVELKTVEEATSKNFIESKVKKYYQQATTFIFDNSKHLLTNEELIEQAYRTFTRPKAASLERIIIVDNYSLVSVIKRPLRQPWCRRKDLNKILIVLYTKH